MKRLIPILVLCLLGLGQLSAQYTVTFELNTDLIPSIDPSGIYIAGGTGFGVPGDNRLLDIDGDGVYSISMSREEGFTSKFVFLNGNCPDYSCQEDLSGLLCADPGNNNQRTFLELKGDTIVRACFGNCEDNGSCELAIDSVAIIFNVNSELLGNVDPEGLFVAGGTGFGAPGDNPLTDEDGDGIYTGIVLRPKGFSSHYTFTNGNCPDYSCKENIAGMSCADPNNFNDRFLAPVEDLMIINACFGACGDDGTCPMAVDSIDIDFDLNTENIVVDPDGIFLAGGGSFGVPGDYPMTDPDGDGIYSITVRRPVGFSSYYTFTNGICPDWSCKEDLSGLGCADPDNFNDRFIDTNTMEDLAVAACFGNCVDNGSCELVNVNNVISDPSLFDIIPTVAFGSTEIQYGESAVGLEKRIVISNLAGQQVYFVTDKGDQAHHINTSGFVAGVYLVSVRTEGAIFTKRFIVQH